MAFSDSVRSTIVLTITQQKLSCLRRDEIALAACRQKIDAQCSGIGRGGLTDDVYRLRIKAGCLHELRLANESSSLSHATSALEFLQLDDGKSLSKKEVQAWNTHLDDMLFHLQKRVQHGVVFSEVMQEWLRETRRAVEDEGSAGQSKSAKDHFTAPASDETALSTPFVPIDYLNSHSYGLQLLEPAFEVQPSEVKQAIEAIASDARLNGPEIRAQLTELTSRADAVNELAASFTIARRHLDEWQWTPTGIPSNLQKHLSGKERTFLNIDTTEMIFLETIGQQWILHFRDALIRIRSGENWPATPTFLNTENAKRVDSVVGMLEASRVDEAGLKMFRSGGMEEARASQGLKNFVFALRSASYTGYAGTQVGDEVIGPSDDGWAGVIDASRTAVSFSEVFRRLQTDIALARALAPADDVFVLHSDIRNFGLSVPHRVIIAVLAFFGVPQGWLTWFEQYLALPQLDRSSTLTTATCGTPFGLSISLLINELLLVLLDCALATGTSVIMSRQHDDCWGWSTESHQIERAWAIMRDFAAQTGLSWNEDKTGCTTVRGPARSFNPNTAKVLRLPNTPVKWGLLELEGTGQWSVDQQTLFDLAAKMRNEVGRDHSKSFLSRIILWNKYHGYIARNVGPITPGNWSTQISTLLSVLRKFQELVLGPTPLHESLDEHFRQRFPAHSDYQLTNWVLSWPIQLGGFQLHPHIIRTLICSKKLNPSPNAPPPQAFVVELKQARRAFDRYHRAWTSEWGHRAWHHYTDGATRALWNHIEDRPDPVTEAEFVRWHALKSDIWRSAYDRLSTPVENSPSDISEMVNNVYAPFAKETLVRLGRCLVDGRLIPRHAAAEFDSATRVMFGSVE